MGNAGKWNDLRVFDGNKASAEIEDYFKIAKKGRKKEVKRRKKEGTKKEKEGKKKEKGKRQ